MQIQLTLTRDTVSPALRAAIGRASDKARLHRVMGMAVVSVTKRAFLVPSLRPAAWKAKKDGTPSRLRKSGTLAKSPRVVSATKAGALVGSDRKYAAIHQLGGRAGIGGSAKMPARPYFPFYRGGGITKQAQRTVESALRGALGF